MTIGLILGAPAQAAEDSGLPANVQAGILARVAAYQRNSPARTAGVFRAVLLVRPGHAESQKAAEQLAGALAHLGAIAGMRHEEIMVNFTGGAGVAELCRRREVSLVVVGPGLAEWVGEIGAALKASRVLTATAVPQYVAKGLGLGMDLVSGKPQILSNPAALREQGVELSPALLAITKVVR